MYIISCNVEEEEAGQTGQAKTVEGGSTLMK